MSFSLCVDRICICGKWQSEPLPETSQLVNIMQQFPAQAECLWLNVHVMHVPLELRLAAARQGEGSNGAILCAEPKQSGDGGEGEARPKQRARQAVRPANRKTLLRQAAMTRSAPPLLHPAARKAITDPWSCSRLARRIMQLSRCPAPLMAPKQSQSLGTGWRQQRRRQIRVAAATRQRMHAARRRMKTRILQQTAARSMRRGRSWMRPLLRHWKRWSWGHTPADHRCLLLRGDLRGLR